MIALHSRGPSHPSDEDLSPGTPTVRSAQEDNSVGSEWFFVCGGESRCALHRPNGTPRLLEDAAFPTLKRGANVRCAYGARIEATFGSGRCGDLR
jgi:hypothetical protein